MRSRPPAQEMEQIVGITAQRGIGHATDSLLVQISIDPLHFPAGLPDHAKRAPSIAQAVLLSYMESHRQASSKEAVKLLSSAATDEKAVGIVALGQ